MGEENQFKLHIKASYYTRLKWQKWMTFIYDDFKNKQTTRVHFNLSILYSFFHHNLFCEPSSIFLISHDQL